MTLPAFTLLFAKTAAVFVPERTRPGSKAEYRMAKGWPGLSTADNAQRIALWSPGDGILGVLNANVAVVDVDTKNGAAIDDVLATMELLGVDIYAEIATPSGGRHFYVAGHEDLPSVAAREGHDGLNGLPGVEILSHGRAVFLPGTSRAKYSGAGYTVLRDDLRRLVAPGPTEIANGERLLTWVRVARTKPLRRDAVASVWKGGPPSERQQRYLQGALKNTTDRVSATPEGERNITLFHNAIGLGALVAGAGLDAEMATEALIAGAEANGYVGDEGLQAALATIRSGMTYGYTVPRAVPDRDVDVTNQADAFEWLRTELGQGRLAGLFRRGQDIVHTPRVGEDGYVPPPEGDQGRDDDGPAQIRRMDAGKIVARVQVAFHVGKWTRSGFQSALFPQPVATVITNADVMDLPSLRPLNSVTNTPVIRPDGTVLDTPGYDELTGVLYLPEQGLSVPRVADRPTRRQIASAVNLLSKPIKEFPFVTTHDRANFLGALLTPLLRPIVRPPYQLVAIDAPQRGSGKSYLAQIMRIVHGGVFRSSFPGDEAELRKVITAILDTTTAPVVQFDNVRGTLDSAVLDGLLTSADWNDRLLGENRNLDLVNDRLWVVTGNNLRIGGDLGRRTLRITIDANVPEPEKRTDFAIPDLEQWVRDNRGQLLHALLTLIRAWAVDGFTTGERPTSDSFGDWIAALRAILEHADMGDSFGKVRHEETVKRIESDDDIEWATFLAAAYRVFGEQRWTVRELLERVSEGEFAEIDMDELPGDIAEKFRRGNASRPLGMWLAHREGRWAGRLSARATEKDRTGTNRWTVVPFRS